MKLPDGIGNADERSLLTGMLEVQRDAIATLLDDLTEDEARTRLVPSLTTPMGLVTHATFVERVWFHSRVAGVARAELGIPDTVEASFVLDDAATVESVTRDFVDACGRSREVAAGRDLEERYEWHGRQVSLRFVLVHMVQELGRHAGHGDILVEQLRARRRTAK